MIGFLLVNILELQKQPQEINRELKSAREELAIAKSVEEPIEGDRFAASIEVRSVSTQANSTFWTSLWHVQDFITRANDDVARLERLDGEMTQSYHHLCDFLAIDSKNYTLTEFFVDLKSFCTFFSVSPIVSHPFVSLLIANDSIFFRRVFRKFVLGENKQLGRQRPRKYWKDVSVVFVLVIDRSPSLWQGLVVTVPISCSVPNVLFVRHRVVSRLDPIRSKISSWRRPRADPLLLVVLLLRSLFADRYFDSL